MFAVDLSYVVRGQDLVVGEVDQEEIQRLGRTLKCLVLVVRLLDEHCPKKEVDVNISIAFS